jgi:protein-S-isoprenylcysteine O-methyltransferase Ste14
MYWEVTDSLVFQSGFAAAAFDLAAGAWCAFELAMTIRQRRLAPDSQARDRTALFMLACSVGSVLVAAQLGGEGRLPWPGGVVWPIALGLALVAAGIGLRAWSIASLGRLFQYRIEVQAEHRVVTDGPYRYVRHPSYSGMALVLVGIALLSGDVESLLAVAIIGGAGLAVRIGVEERQLTEALGAEYERFAAQRKLLVPGVL